MFLNKHLFLYLCLCNLCQVNWENTSPHPKFKTYQSENLVEGGRFYVVLIHLFKYFGEIQCYLLVGEHVFCMRQSHFGKYPHSASKLQLTYNWIKHLKHLFSGLRTKTPTSLYNDFFKVRLHLLTQKSTPTSCLNTPLQPGPHSFHVLLF